MAIDTENKRRSITGIFHAFTIPPEADGTIDVNDRKQAALIYSGSMVAAVSRILKTFIATARDYYFRAVARPYNFISRNRKYQFFAKGDS